MLRYASLESCYIVRKNHNVLIAIIQKIVPLVAFENRSAVSITFDRDSVEEHHEHGSLNRRVHVNREVQILPLVPLRRYRPGRLSVVLEQEHKKISYPMPKKFQDSHWLQ